MRNLFQWDLKLVHSLMGMCVPVCPKIQDEFMGDYSE